MRIPTVLKLVATSLLLAMLWAAVGDAQCSMCKESLASGGKGGLLLGFKLSVALLLAVPFTMVSLAILILARSCRRQKRRQQEALLARNR